MTADNEATATFNLEQHKLKVTRAGSGGGTVVSSPAGINCTTGTCEASFNHGTLVKLKGTPNAGSTAVSWGASGCPGTVNGSNECEVTMTADKEATATFNLGQHQLTVQEGGTGTGTVTSTPEG